MIHAYIDLMIPTLGEADEKEEKVPDAERIDF